MDLEYRIESIMITFDEHLSNTNAKTCVGINIDYVYNILLPYKCYEYSPTHETIFAMLTFRFK